MLSRITSIVRVVLLTSVLTVGLALNSALADKTYEFPKEKPVFTISYPDSWTEIYFDEEYVEYGVKEEISIGAWMLKGKKDIMEAATAVGEEIGEYVKDFKVAGDAKELKVGSLDMLLVEGTGTDKKTGKALIVQAAFFSPDGKSICALLYYSDKTVADKYTADVSKILKSIKAK